MIYKSLRNSLLIFISLFVFSSSISAQQSVDIGKSIFRNYCANCHNKDMKSDATGPALGGAEERWADYPREDLYKWIWNSQALIAEGHPRANEVFKEWKTVMTAWPDLTVDEIESVLLYVDCMYNAGPECTKQAAPGALVSDAGAGAAEKNKWTIPILLAVLGLLALFLARVVINLNKLVYAKDGKIYEGQSLTQILTSKKVVSFGIFALILFGGYMTVNKAVDLGRQQTYAPDQPINFSHETHAGLHKIECQYCHDGARRSKHAVIPAANTCMNCHKAIKVGSEHGTAELTKIYASIGYDPSTNAYIENYDDMSQEDIEEIYKKWISDSYLNEEELTELDLEGEELVNDQWEDIVSSLTNEQKTKVQGPIEWIRIHNLPDHVYFNHAQHVNVGKLECQQCHGAVEEMDVVSQHSPLSMGWCVNCHRQTDVQFADNPYYESYAKYHEELKDGSRGSVTVEDIGGLECQKCHY